MDNVSVSAIFASLYDVYVYIRQTASLVSVQKQ